MRSAARRRAGLDQAQSARTTRCAPKPSRRCSSDPDESKLPIVEQGLAAETDPKIKDQLDAGARRRRCSTAPTRPSGSTRPRALGADTSPDTKLLLDQRLSDETEPDVKAAHRSPRSARSTGTLVWGDRIGAIFSGISLGSVLLLSALGLAITYGLMGVINMAHGELMMIGAYATYVVQSVFQHYLPASVVRPLPGGGDPGVVPRLGAGRRGPGARRDPLPVRPAARDAAGHLGHQPDAAAAGAHASSAPRTSASRTRPG